MKKNPITMVGTIERCWLFAFRTPAQDAAARLPAPLTPVTRDGFAFWNVVVCRVGSMRPRLVPRFLGMSYWHVAYRLYARFQPAAGGAIEGLHFLRSDCDRPLLAAVGNLVTDLRFHTAEVTVEDRDSQLRLRIESPEASARVEIDRTRPVELSPGSPFRTVEEAAAFLKYRPVGLSVEPDGRVNVVRIEREERAWRARPVAVTGQHWTFLDRMPALPELATEVDPIRYRWHSGERVEARRC